jgi:luciferase family oxidoreductase group 1
VTSIPLSVLDLAPVVKGSDAGTALRNSLDLARHVERLGYLRFWMAEHHAMPGVASAATAVALAHVAAGTSTIRVGAGGIMLPNHAPLIIAEQFGTLAALHPGRVDLGLGRAPGTDPLTTRALRRTLAGDVDRFPDDVLELQAFLDDPKDDQPILAVPGAGTKIPIWILGSSTYGAQLAAALGLPYAFASHFAPAALDDAIRVYRERFRPSAEHPRPLLMLGVNVIAAETDDEAMRLATSLTQAFLNLRRGKREPIAPPVDPAALDAQMLPHERAMLDEIFRCSFVGTPERVTRDLRAFAEEKRADELIVASMVFDHQARKRSYQLLAEGHSA